SCRLSPAMAKDNEYWQSVINKTYETLTDLQTEKSTHEAEVERINREIIHLERALVGLSAFADTDDEPSGVAVVEGVADLKLADACRKVFQQTNFYRTARGVRDSLEASGYDLKSQHNNPL